MGLVELDVGRLDRELAAVRHRVARVHRQVEHDLRDLRRVRLDAAEPRRCLDDERDVLADQAPEHRLDPGHRRVEIEDLGREHLLSAEREQLPRQVAGVARGLVDDAHPAEQGLVALEIRFEQLPVARDHREQTVEVVRDAAGQPSDALHLL
ncbi:MAG: hypothetical protein FJZ38_21730 [Candidatus Rokubacteria bacterium]|nr:hypothetical protein [Candidatus Rokubacteria bacterium]